MSKRSFIFFAFLFCSFAATAQVEVPSEKERFFNFGIGYTFPKFIDKSFSSLRYQGHAASVVSGFHFRKPARGHYLDFRFDYGELSNKTNMARVDNFRFEGNYAYRHYVKSFWQDRIQWHAGGSVNGLWTLWIHKSFSNNAFNNSVYLSLSPNTSLTYKFELFDRQFQAEWSAFLPLLTFAMRPSYGASSFFGFLNDEREDIFMQVLESTKVASLNKFFRYSNAFSLEYVLKNANRLKLSYEWNFLQYSEPRVVKAASHNITFSTMFNF